MVREGKGRIGNSRATWMGLLAGVAAATGCGRLSVPPPRPSVVGKAPVVASGAFSLSVYRTLDLVERQEALQEVEEGRRIASDVDLVRAYRLETTPGRRTEIVDLLRDRPSPARDRAVLVGFGRATGPAWKMDLAVALSHPQTPAARNALDALTRDPDRWVRRKAQRVLRGRHDPAEQMLERDEMAHSPPPGAR